VPYGGGALPVRPLPCFSRYFGFGPLYARAASDNAGSLRVLEKTGFRIIETEVSFAPARGAKIEETILQLG
jgi:RimJ/RimL family protein N-acetyltransferase